MCFTFQNFWVQLKLITFCQEQEPKHGITRAVFQSVKSQIRSDVDLKEAVTLIMAVMDGLQIQWLLDPEKVDMVKTFKLFSRMIVEYLEGHP